MGELESYAGERELVGGAMNEWELVVELAEFRRLAVFSFLAVTTLAEAAKPKHGGIFSAVMHYSGNFLSVSCSSFFGGNVNVNSKLGSSCGAYLAICRHVLGARTSGKPLSAGYPCTHPLHGWFVRRFQARNRGKINKKNCGYLFNHEWN